MDTKEQKTGDAVGQSEACVPGRTRPIQKRRQYSKAYKRQVVEETLTGEDSVSVVARRHDINTNLLFTWRKQYLAGKYDTGEGSSLIPIAMTPVELSTPEHTEEDFRERSDKGRLEIVLSGGHRVVVEGTVSPAMLRTALEVLTA